MIKNAAECLRTGGYFIGTIPDAFEIVRRQRLAGKPTFGNEVYQIGFLCDTNEPPLFGGKYNFKLQGVVDCPEFLVHFPLLVKLARKYGLKLAMKESFSGYFRRMIDSCKCLQHRISFQIDNSYSYSRVLNSRRIAKGLIEKMQGLQAYPSHDQSAEHREQFAHAAEFLASRDCGDRQKKCATLSKAEWEATCAYNLFLRLVMAVR